MSGSLSKGSASVSSSCRAPSCSKRYPYILAAEANGFGGRRGESHRAQRDSSGSGMNGDCSRSPGPESRSAGLPPPQRGSGALSPGARRAPTARSARRPSRPRPPSRRRRVSPPLRSPGPAVGAAVPVPFPALEKLLPAPPQPRLRLCQRAAAEAGAGEPVCAPPLPGRPAGGIPGCPRCFPDGPIVGRDPVSMTGGAVETAWEHSLRS